MVAAGLTSHEARPESMPGSFNVFDSGSATIVVDRPMPSWFLRTSLRAAANLGSGRQIRVAGPMPDVFTDDLSKLAGSWDATEACSSSMATGLQSAWGACAKALPEMPSRRFSFKFLMNEPRYSRRWACFAPTMSCWFWPKTPRATVLSNAASPRSVAASSGRPAVKA